MDGVTQPYDCRCYRARVSDQPVALGDPGRDAEDAVGGSGTLLIDFR